MGENGWTFDTAEGSSGDAVNGKGAFVRDLSAGRSKFTGRVTVPVLWDKQKKDDRQQRVVEIIRMLNSAFDALHQ